MPGVDTPRTPTTAIAEAIMEELRRRREVLDANEALASVTITCYIERGSPHVVGSVTVAEHTERRRRRNS